MAVPLKPTIDEYRSTITLNLSDAMVEHCSKEKNRSKQILRLMDKYLNQLNIDLKQTHEHYIVTISKPWSNLNDKIYKAVKNGIAFSRSELFRQAIIWDMHREGTKKEMRLVEDAENNVVRVPNEKGETIYNVIGTA